MCVYPGATARRAKYFHSLTLRVNSIRRNSWSLVFQADTVPESPWWRSGNFLPRFRVGRPFSGHSGGVEVTDKCSAYLSLLYP